MAEYTKSEAMDWARENLRGQWTTLMTPFTDDDEFDEEGMRRNIRHIRSLGTQGAGCTWGMGEFWSLNPRRANARLQCRRGRGWRRMAHRRARNPHLVQRHDRAGKARRRDRLRLLICAAPYFVTKTEDQVVDWMRMLADNTNLAIMYYNSPQFGIVMSAQGLGQICSIPNIVGVKEASFNQELSIESHQLLGRDAIISTPDEWIMFKGRELGFEQQVMFANTSDWRFDTPEKNYYNQFIDKAMRGDLDDDFYAKHVRPIKAVSDKWWASTVQKANGALPAPMCKYWGEVMGMAGGHVRQPHINLTDDEKAELKSEIEAALDQI